MACLTSLSLFETKYDNDNDDDYNDDNDKNDGGGGRYTSSYF